MTDALIPLVQLMFKVGLEHREHERQSLLQVVQMLQGVSKMGNRESSCGSRGLHSCIRHHIQYALIPVMTDSSDDRQGEVCDILGKRQGVETAHVTG